MKLLLTTILAFFLFSCSNGISTNDVPEVVLSSFTNNYSTAENPTWEKKGEEYIVKFTKDKEITFVTLSNTGVVLKEESQNEQVDDDIDTIIHSRH